MEMFSLNEVYTDRSGIIVTLDLSVFLNDSCAYETIFKQQEFKIKVPSFSLISKLICVFAPQIIPIAK